MNAEHPSLAAPRPGRARRAALPAMLLAVAGCAAGPDFTRPAPPEVAGYLASAPATPAAGAPSAAPAADGAQRLLPGMPIDARWWRALASPKLDALIASALEASPSLEAARATLRQAQELHAAQAGATLLPRADAGLGAQRQRLSPSALGQPGNAREFSLYNANVSVRYSLDLSGGNRRALEALAARADFRRHELDAARLSLAGNLATAAIAQARLDAQLGALTAILQAQEEQLRIARERVRLGQAAPAEALALQTLAEQTRAELPALRKQSQQTGHLLAVLAGRAPGAGEPPAFSLADFTLPAELPLAVPSELVRRRPDILASEALMHAAHAEYGAAVARRYPQLALSASLGSQALTTGALFGGGSAVWSLLGQLTQPLLHAGLPAERRAALAAFEAAAANYQGVVLNALRNVADALRAIEHDAQSASALASADEAAQASLRSVEQQHRLGAAGYLQLLVAQQQAHQTALGLAAARAQQLADSVALLQAMAGGS